MTNLEPPEDMDPLPENSETKYALRQGPNSDLWAEEIALIDYVSNVLTDWLGPDAAPIEREALLMALAAQDADLAGAAWRLEALSQANSHSVMLGLARLAEEDREEEEEEQ